MGAVLDTKALNDAVAEIKTATASISGVRDEVTKTAATVKALDERMSAVEAATRERPNFTGKSEDGRSFFRGTEMRSLYPNGRKGGYKGVFDIPNMSPKEAQDFRFAKVLSGLRAGGKFDGVEKLVHDEWLKLKTVLTLGDDLAAGFYIPNQVMDEIIDPLRATSVKSQLGMQMLTGLTSSPIEFPRQVGVETAFMVGEDTAITESNQTADQISLRPHMAGVLSKASLSLLQKAPGVVENRLRRSITRTLELKEDDQLFQGSGVAPNVRGLKNITGINTVAHSGASAAVTWEKLQQCIKELEIDNVEITGGKWVMHATDWHVFWLKQIQQISTDKAFVPYLSFGPGADGLPAKFIHGYPVVICNTITAGTAFFVNWPDVMWAEWLNPGIAYSEHFEFNKVNGVFRIVKEFDANVEHPESVCTLTSIS